MHQRCVRHFVPDEGTYQDADAGTDEGADGGAYACAYTDSDSGADGVSYGCANVVPNAGSYARAYRLPD